MQYHNSSALRRASVLALVLASTTAMANPGVTAALIGNSASNQKAAANAAAAASPTPISSKSGGPVGTKVGAVSMLILDGYVERKILNQEWSRVPRNIQGAARELPLVIDVSPETPYYRVCDLRGPQEGLIRCNSPDGKPVELSQFLRTSKSYPHGEVQGIGLNTHTQTLLVYYRLQ